MYFVRRCTIVAALFTLLAIAPAFPQATSPADIPDELELNLSDDLAWAELLGPLAPVALSPFFGITCLSGASMLMDQGLLPENRFIQENPLLNQPAVFVVFLILTLATSLPKLSKVSKPLAQALDHVEAYAGVITMLVLQHIAQQPAAAEPVAVAGVLLSVQEVLLMGVAAVNILVIHTVKFFFETLILISPIPLVDALFETANKGMCAGLVLIYSLNPMIAMVINGLLFFVCLCLVGWCHRKTLYYRHLLLDPITHKIRSLIGLSKPPSINPADLTGRLAPAAADATIAIPVFPNQAVGSIKKQARCQLVGEPGNWKLIQPRWLRSPKVESVFESEQPVVTDAWIANLIQSTEPGSPGLEFSSRYDDLLDEFATRAGMTLQAGSGWQETFTGSFSDLGKRIASSVRN